jgi:hypothetical protein
VRGEQQFDSLEDVRLIVGSQNPNFFLPTGDDSPPGLSPLSFRQSRLHGLRERSRWRDAKGVAARQAWSLSLILRRLSHDALFRVIDGDPSPFQCLADSAVDIYLLLLVVGLRRVQSELGLGECVFCG